MSRISPGPGSTPDYQDNRAAPSAAPLCHFFSPHRAFRPTATLSRADEEQPRLRIGHVAQMRPQVPCLDRSARIRGRVARSAGPSAVRENPVSASVIVEKLQFTRRAYLCRNETEPALTANDLPEKRENSPFHAGETSLLFRRSDAIVTLCASPAWCIGFSRQASTSGRSKSLLGHNDILFSRLANRICRYVRCGSYPRAAAGALARAIRDRCRFQR